MYVMCSCNTRHMSKSIFYCTDYKYVLEVPLKKIDSYVSNNVDYYTQSNLYKDTAMSVFICGLNYSKEPDESFIEKFRHTKADYNVRGGTMKNQKSWIQIETHFCLLRLWNFNEQVLDSVKMNNVYIGKLRENIYSEK